MAAQFHATLNAPRGGITIGSNVPLSWECAQGHVYEQAAERRNAGYGCPYCSGQPFELGITDVLTLHPDLCREWHPDKNGTLQSQDRGARKRTIWWKRLKEGHVTQQTIILRIKSGGCTECPRNERIRPSRNDLD